LLLGVVAAAALAATGDGLAASPKTVTGTVGPGFTIGLVMHGKKVKKLKAGTAYRFVIRDRSSIHDFRLRKGSYRFVCDPHSGIMHGRFNVS